MQHDSTGRSPASENPGMNRVQTFARVRPPLPREIKPEGFTRCLGVPPGAESKRLLVATTDQPVLLDSRGCIAGSPPAGLKSFALDKCFQEHSTTADVYDGSCKPLVENVRSHGRNATFLCYGMTGSGKTHTMMGTPTEPGLIAQAVHDLLTGGKGAVSLSFLQIYGKELTDLLSTDEVRLAI